MFAREEVLGQLLGDGASAAAAAMTADEGLEEDAEKAAGVDAGVFIEAHILGGDKGVDEVGRELVVGYVGTVLDADETKDFAIGGDDLGGLIALRIFQLLERGHEAEPAQREQGEEEKDENP